MVKIIIQFVIKNNLLNIYIKWYHFVYIKYSLNNIFVICSFLIS